MAKPRIEYIDLAKGICIMLVVYDHVYCTLDVNPLYKAMMLFRMPLYFTLSGLFFKTYENFKGFFLRKVNKLLIPFLFFYFIFAVLLFNLNTIIDTHQLTFDWSSLTGFITKESFWDMPIWFLLTLFLMNIYFYAIYRISESFSRHEEWWLCSLSLLVGLVGYYLGYAEINLPAFLDTAMTATPFFAFGYMLRAHTSILNQSKWDKFSWLAGICLAVITIILTNGTVEFYSNTTNLTAFNLYIGGICGSLAVLLIAKKIKYIPLVSYFGRYSIIILVLHFPIRLLYVDLALKLGLGTFVTILIAFLLLMLSFIIFIPLAIKFIPHFTAQNDLIPIENKKK